jgi:glycosyltransferase involved in cell wall biosynthesis
MHILLVADGRSAITAGWLRMMSRLDYRVSLVSTFPCDPPEGADLVAVLPVAFSSFAGGQVRISDRSSAIDKTEKSWKRRMISAFRPAFLALRAWLAPLTMRKYQSQFTRIVCGLQPDMVHALRIPFEGMLASVTPKDIPFLVSTWGNDLTLHAHTSPFMAAHTRKALKRADGLISDTHRDVRLAKEWSLSGDAPTLVVPGNGGLDLDRVKEIIRRNDLSFDLPQDRPLIINPRGFRPGSVHQDTFFKSIPLVLEKVPQAFFICTAMLGQPEAEKWVRALGIQDHILLLPYLPQEQLWQLYSRSQVYVSLSSHDGTPNTFLEALACGCFPVVGDIESLREWLSDGENGLLVDPRDYEATANAVIEALSSDSLLESARQKNMKMIKQRAGVDQVGQRVKEFLFRFQ